jgi:hypothetical protein
MRNSPTSREKEACMSTWYQDRTLRTVLAVLVVAAGIALAVTTGDSYAVRWVTLLLSFDVGARLAFGRREP